MKRCKRCGEEINLKDLPLGFGITLDSRFKYYCENCKRIIKI